MLNPSGLTISKNSLYLLPIPLGKHIVYLYGRKSKVNFIDQFDVLITLSQQD